MLLKNISHLRTIFSKFVFLNEVHKILRASSSLSSATGRTRLKMEGDIKIRLNPVVMKLDTPEFKSIFTQELHNLIELFKKYNHEIRIAGGAVRDLLMNIRPKDIDFATTATPEEMKEMFTKEGIRMINMKGEKHGTITPRINDKENFEVTTLRIDVITDGRHAEVQFTTDWQLDANRRDLTINSMFLGLDGLVYDYFYGYDDLLKRRVAFVGNPVIRIREDYLRILRYFRFYGRIAEVYNNHDEQTLKAISSNVDGLQKISGERIWSEVKKILEGNFAMELMIEMIKCGIAKYIGLPEQPDIDEFKRVCENSKKFEESCYPITLIIGLLFNADDAIKLHERLKLSAFERDLGLFITQNRDAIKKLNDIMDFKKLSMQPNIKKEYVVEMLKYDGQVNLYNELNEWTIPHFKINGNMLKERGCPAGRMIGVAMNKLRLIWVNDNFETSSEDLLNIHLPKILEELKTEKDNHINKKLKTVK